jgi:hypothetical protein
MITWSTNLLYKSLYYSMLLFVFNTWQDYPILSILPSVFLQPSTLKYILIVNYIMALHNITDMKVYFSAKQNLNWRLHITKGV